MKLNRGLLLVTMLVGAVAVTGCSTSSDEGAEPEGATSEMASTANDQGAGTVEYARFGHGGRGEHGGGRGERGGRGEHGGRGERGGRGEHGGRGHRSWWQFWG